MYPFGGLPENLVAFCAFLRGEEGFAIGPAETRDAARALEMVDFTDERIVRDALRPVLSRTSQEAAAFDGAFNAFFFPGPEGVPQPALPPLARAREHVPGSGEADGGDARTRSNGLAAAEGTGVDGPGPSTSAPASDGPAALTLTRLEYSPLERRQAGEAQMLGPTDAAWHAAARSFVRRLQLGSARRWRPSPRGRRFDLRRTLRASVQTGGESLTIRWLRRPKRAPRFVLLVDGSRSMAAHASAALEIAVALASVTMRVEAFTFSTGLQRVTDHVRRAAAGRPLRLDLLPGAWGGGTSIGRSLGDFLRRFGERLLGPGTLVLVVSDGLDLGEPDELREAMHGLRRRSAGIVWLNPLLDTAGYEPTAAGMAAARPFVTTLASANDPAGLVRLSRIVRVRR